jgi:Tfp pilus assembly major pilin PilA
VHSGFKKNRTKLNHNIHFLTKKIKGNTLPEVLIAIVIIVFTSTLGITIYLNIQNNTQPFIKLKANEVANLYLKKCEAEENYFDDTIKEEEFTIKKTTKRLDNYSDCLVITITVSSFQEKEICVIHKILYAHK